MLREILKTFQSAGMLLDPDVCDHIKAQDNPVAYAKAIVNTIQDHPLVFTMEKLRTIEGG